MDVMAERPRRVDTRARGVGAIRFANRSVAFDLAVGRIQQYAQENMGMACNVLSFSTFVAPGKPFMRTKRR